jgi:hypothetical protein
MLAKAVQHKNLSAAAVHVGLSQPQLSRLVSKIENELQIVLLDRTARRKSGWTQVALDLSATFTKGMGRLESEIVALAQEVEINEIHIGTLEGLSTIANGFAKDCFDKLKMKTVYLDVLDFKDLDSQFLGGTLDLIFTVRPPGKQKFHHILEVGYQQTEKITTGKETLVASHYELTGADKKSFEGIEHFFICNSLSMRRQWLKDVGGTGNLPAEPKKGRGKGQFTIYLVGSNILTPKIWDRISQLF